MPTPLNIPDQIVAMLLVLGILPGLLVGFGFLLRPLGNKKANAFYGVFLMSFALSLSNNLFLHLGFFHQYPALHYVPLWYTLVFGPCLFYYVKLNVYPSYELRWTDAKHFALPLLQALFYWIAWFQPVGTKHWITSEIYLPYYKTLEGVLFVFSFFSYLALAYRYLKFKEATIKKFGGFGWEYQKVRWLKHVLRVLFLLAGLNTFYLICDFIAFNFFNVNLYGIKTYAYFGDLSFAAILYWLAFAGIRNELFGLPLRHAAPKDQALQQRSQQTKDELLEVLSEKMERDKLYRDPELKLTQLARFLAISRSNLGQVIQARWQKSFREWVDEYRVKEVKEHLQSPKYRRHSTESLGYISGFTSRKNFWKTFRKHTGKTPEHFRAAQTSNQGLPL